MEKNLYTSSFNNEKKEIRKFLKNALMFLIVFAAIHSALLNCVEKPEAKNQLASLIYKKNKIRNGENYHTIIIGDSTAMAMNYDKNIATSNNIYNYAFSNNIGMYQYVYFLEKYLLYCPPPKNIILSFNPFVCAMPDVFENAHSVFDVGSQSFLYDTYDILTNKIFYKYPLFSFYVLLQKLNINKFYYGYKGDLHETFIKETGCVIFTNDENQFFQENVNTVIGEVYNDFPKTQIDHILRFIQICSVHKIRVFFCTMPVSKSSFFYRQKHNSYAPLFSALEKAAAQYPETLTIDREIRYYSNKEFLDFIHLNIPGAQLYSDSVFTETVAKITQ